MAGGGRTHTTSSGKSKSLWYIHTRWSSIKVLMGGCDEGVWHCGWITLPTPPFPYTSLALPNHATGTNLVAVVVSHGQQWTSPLYKIFFSFWLHNVVCFAVTHLTFVKPHGTGCYQTQRLKMNVVLLKCIVCWLHIRTSMTEQMFLTHKSVCM